MSRFIPRPTLADLLKAETATFVTKGSTDCRGIVHHGVWPVPNPVVRRYMDEQITAGAWERCDDVPHASRCRCIR